jgi:putative membrane protein
LPGLEVEAHALAACPGWCCERVGLEDAAAVVASRRHLLRGHVGLRLELLGEGVARGERLGVLPHQHVELVFHGQTIPVLDHLGQLVARVDVHERERHVPEEGLARQPEEDGGVLADGPQHAEALEVAESFPKDVDALLLELIEVVHDAAGRSFLAVSVGAVRGLEYAIVRPRPHVAAALKRVVPRRFWAKLDAMYTLLHLAVLTGTVLLLAYLMPGVQIKNTKSAVLVAVVFSIINFLAGWLVKLLLGAVLIIPAILTLGLAWILVPFLANTLMLWVTDELLDTFELRDTKTLFLAAGGITLANGLFHILTHH